MGSRVVARGGRHHFVMIVPPAAVLRSGAVDRERLGGRFVLSAVRALRVQLTLAVLCLALLLGCASAAPGNGRFEIALIGDQQYNAESDAQFARLLEHLDRSPLAFVVHVGAFKAGTSMPCDDGLFRSRKDQFDSSRHPFIYTPGDNDWTDCHIPKAGGFEPQERLAKLREIFYPDSRSLGRRTLTVRRQSDDPRYAEFRENTRWRYGGVMFATLHIVGSNNNLGRTPGQDSEYRGRNAANLAWLKDTFDVAKREGSKAVAIFMQANPRFEHHLPAGRIQALGLAPAPSAPSGFADFVPALEAEVVSFGKPVVVLHGDSHYCRVDKPLFRTGVKSQGDRGRQIENFTRVEVHGFPEVHWVRVIVDPDDAAVFSFKEEVVEQNRLKR